MGTVTPSARPSPRRPRRAPRAVAAAAVAALALAAPPRPARAITRCEALDRAQAWVDDGVLYSQTAWYTDPTTGRCCYRSDCSGLVSAAWGLPPPGHTTYSFAGGPWDDGVSYVISPGDLQPGDALNDPAHHIMLYVSGNFYSGWVEVYEEYNWGHPAVRRWRSIDPGQYLAIRYVNIEPCCTPHPEVCNGRDDDCDGRVDENATAEACNGEDDDCDGQIDEGVTRRCGTDVGECEFGTERCVGGVWGTCAGAVGPAPELCDRLDNDCDGAADDEQVCEIEEVILQSGLHDERTDVDGDGLPDLCGRTATGAGYGCTLGTGHGFDRPFGEIQLPPGLDAPDVARAATLHLGDVDGDGRSDVCGRGADGLRCWRSSGAGFDVALEGPAWTDAAGWLEPRYDTTVRLADVDGDGRDDACARGVDGFRCHPSTGAGFGAPISIPELSDAVGWGDVQYYGTLRMGDVDGDGRDDVCGRARAGVTCWLAGERGFDRRVAGPAWSDATGWDALERWSTIRLVDLDGDRRADLCGRSAQGLACHLSDGAGFGVTVVGPALSDEAGWNERARFSTIRMGDVDGDGRADVCARGAAGVTCWLFTGRAFDRQIPGPLLADAAGWTEPSWYRTIRLADLDGDGRADLLARDADGLRSWRSSGAGFPAVFLGPGLSDAEGWAEPSRYATLRVAGGAAAGGPVAGVPELAGGCAVAPRRRPGDRGAEGTWRWLALLGLAPWAARRRRI